MRTLKQYSKTKQSLENLKPHARRRVVVQQRLTDLMTKLLQEGDRLEKRAARAK